MYLSYNRDNQRYGILSGDLWVDDGLHCGQHLIVETADGQIPTRLEMTVDGKWYLDGTDYIDHALEGLTVHYVES